MGTVAEPRLPSSNLAHDPHLSGLIERRRGGLRRASLSIRVFALLPQFGGRGATPAA